MTYLTGAQRFRQVRAKARIMAERNLRKFLADEIDMLPGSLDYEREQIIREFDRAFEAGVQHGKSTPLPEDSR